VPPGNLTYTVTVVIEVSVSPSVSLEFIEQSARRQLLEKAGFKNVKSIEVVRND
jgi:hypothetical protein